MLYVPCEPSLMPDGSARLALRKTKDGRTALLAYTALDRLVECCGVTQPWVLVATETLDQVNQVQAFDVLYLDLHIPAERRSEMAMS